MCQISCGWMGSIGERETKTMGCCVVVVCKGITFAWGEGREVLAVCSARNRPLFLCV